MSAPDHARTVQRYADGILADRARHAQRTALAAVIHASEHHDAIYDECAGQCFATAERVLEHLETEQ